MRRPRSLVAVGLLALLTTTACSEASDDPLGGREDSTADDGARYVALGDSFSAGGGAPPYRTDGANCFRSDLSWPLLLDEGPVDLFACGGATIPDLLAGRPDGTRDPQLPVAPRPEVELVTITLGWNDMRYPTFASTCVTGDCAASFDERVADLLLQTFRENALDDLYPAIHKKFPEARIVHVGYPQLVPADIADVVSCPWLTGPELELLRDIENDIDAMLRNAAREADDLGLPVEFLQTTDALEGHELCTAGSQVVPMGAPDGSGGHMDADGYATFAQAVRAGL